MPWENLSHLTALAEIKEVSVKGPGTLTRSARPTTAQKLAPIPTETAAGGPTAPHPPEVVNFIQRQAQSIRRYSADPKLRLRPWLNDAITQSNQNLDMLVTKTIEQLRTAINEQSLLEAQAALNELGRTPQGTAAVRRQLTTATMKSIIQLSKRKA